MSLIIAAAGWLLEKSAGKLVERWTESCCERYGLFKATCERCRCTIPRVEIPENRRYDLCCSHCGHRGTILIENLETLIIHQVQYASIYIQYAQIRVGSDTRMDTTPSSLQAAAPPADPPRPVVRRVDVSQARALP